MISSIWADKNSSSFSLLLNLIPSSSYIFRIYKDHAIVDLAVRSSETNTDFLNGKVTFFECQLHTT